MESIGEVTAKLYEFEWRIPDFDTLSNDDAKGYVSPDVSFAGASWTLGIFPKGSISNKSVGYIDLCFGRQSCYPPFNLQVSFSFKSVDGKKDRERHSERFISTGKWEMYRAHRCLSRAELLERELQLLPFNVLNVICTVKFLESTKDAGEFCGSGSSIFPQVNKVLHDLKELYFKKEDCDLVIKVKGYEFLAHKIILKTRSSVFASIFRTDRKKKNNRIVEIDDCDPRYFSDFLCFLYCGDVETISQENVFSLFTVADKYDVQDLKEKCLTFMKANLSVDTFYDTITLALRYSETELTKFTTVFFTKNAPKIVVTDNWQLFLDENPTQSNALLIKLLVHHRSSSG